jgi:hypothetical protein
MGCRVGHLGSVGCFGSRKLCGIQIQIKGKLTDVEYYLQSCSFHSCT